MAETRRRKLKPKDKKFDGVISFGVTEAMEAAIYAFQDRTPTIENTAAACRYLIQRGLDSAKEAAE